MFARLDPIVLEARFQDWVRLLAAKLGGQLIALDGVRPSKAPTTEKLGSTLSNLSVPGPVRGRIVLGQGAVDSKSNEITAIPLLIEQLDVADAIISIDAMGTQVAIAQQIRQASADYILALKGNQPTLSQAAIEWFARYTQQTATVPHEMRYS